MPLDIATLAPVDTIAVVFIHPKTKAVLKDDHGTIVVFRVKGADSFDFRTARAGLVQRTFKELRKEDGTIDELDERALDDKVCVEMGLATEGWSGELSLDGVIIPPGPEGAAKVYRHVRWMREQVEQAHRDRARFFPTLPPAPSDTPAPNSN